MSKIDCAFVAMPMHGEIKLRVGGLRTRDAHLLEWLATPGRPASIISRAEPWPRLTLVRLRRSKPLHGSWRMISPEPLALPTLLPRRRRRWWMQAVAWQPACDPTLPLIAWDPFALAAAPAGRRSTIVFDLLDDWTVHAAFAGMRTDVSAAYQQAFARADVVIANSEGTADLARRFGRPDAITIPNGVDPDRFTTTSHAAGDRTVVGYAGKIGSRLDIDAIEGTTRALPQCRFLFAGPVLEQRIGRRLRRLPNVELIGDVHYERYPALLQTWDVGWVPHRVGDGEVGGDAIKTYEYRAAGLPTLTTAIIGCHRLPEVETAEAADLPLVLGGWLEETDGPRIGRKPAAVPAEHTWSDKAARVGRLLFGERAPGAGTRSSSASQAATRGPGA